MKLDFLSARLSGPNIGEKVVRLADLTGVFRDDKARQQMDPARVVYRVQSFLPVPEGTAGGLFFGATAIEPGLVGDEYFMTRGHFHTCRDRAEYYVASRGSGALLLMDEERRARVEWMSPGSIHYIPGRTAHRVVNTGETELSFFACWGSDAGHDYGSIEKSGFPARLCRRDGASVVVEEA